MYVKQSFIMHTSMLYLYSYNWLLLLQSWLTQAMQMIHDFTPKLNIDDKNRVRKAVEHYEPYIDFEQLLDRASEE